MLFKLVLVNRVFNIGVPDLLKTFLEINPKMSKRRRLKCSVFVLRVHLN